MNIGLDVNPLVTGHQFRGIGAYVKNLLKALLDSPDRYEFFLYYNCGNLKYPGKKKPQLHYLPEQKSYLPGLIQKDGILLLHITDFYHPVCSPVILEEIKRQGVKVILSLADAIPLRFPEYYPGEGSFIERNLKPMLPLVDRVLAISRATAEDIIHYYQLPSEKVAVTHLGVDQEFFSPVGTAQDRQVLNLYGINPPYFLYVGGYDWRKNWEMVVKAHTGIPRTSGRNAQLVFVGSGPPLDLCRMVGSGKPVITGFIPEGHLPPLYRNAAALVFPSRFEGFGLPILEAMACGTPVIAANTSSIPEVTGDSALIIEPDDLAGWQRSMRNVLTNKDLVEAQRQKGLARVKKFTWAECARQTRQAYKLLLT